MAEESSDVESPQGKAEGVIFVSDASAEAERLISTLRGRGYSAFDVPLGVLVSRVAVQRPMLIICDIDAPAALKQIQALRGVQGADGIDVLFVGRPGGALDQNREEVMPEASAVFLRPFEPLTLLRKVEALVGAPTAQPGQQAAPNSSARPPVLVAATRRPVLYDGTSDTADGSSASGVGLRPQLDRELLKTPHARPKPSPPPAPPGVAPSLSGGHPEPDGAPSDYDLGGMTEQRDSEWMQRVPQAEISPHLQKMLNQAELRLSLAPVSSAAPVERLSPEEEVDAVLPQEVLAALDEPLGFEEEGDFEGAPGRVASGDASDTGTGRERTGGSTTGGGTGPLRRPSSATAVSTGTGSGNTTGSGTGSGAGTDTGAGTGPGAQPARTRGDPETSRPTPRPPRPSASDWAASAARSERSALLTGTPEPQLTHGSVRPAIRTSIGSAPPPESARRQELSPPASAPSQRQTAMPPAPHAPRAAAARAPGEAPFGRSARPAPLEPALRLPSSLPSEPPQSGAGQRTMAEPRKAYLDAAGKSRERDAEAPEIPSTLRAGDTLRALASVIRARYSGALAVETSAGVRRIVFRDGDFVTVASGIEDDSLVAYLVERGDISAEVGAGIGRRVPPYGRHAGAALIAQGHLRQDDLWTVLRAHAEWLLTKIVKTEEGGASLESIPERLNAEPAVFGGATGAEILVEIARRSISPEFARERLGKATLSLAASTAYHLLGECALSEDETRWIREAPTVALGALLERTESPDWATVLHVMVELKVLEVTSPKEVQRASAVRAPSPDPLDEAALRARIKTRRALVDEGDYFALLGLPRSATTYDVRRAYLELRRSFDPSQVVTPATIDLREDVDTILEVLDEAFDILRDQTRLQRYLRALEASP